MAKEMKKPNIYQYDDFRLFIRDCYMARAQAAIKYSYRKFAAEAGFSNPGYINDVIKGRRNLSKAAFNKTVAVFQLNQKEGEYLRLLVQYGQAKKESDRDAYYQQILFRRSRSSFTRLNANLIKYYQDYRYPLVRSAIEVKPFRGEYDLLAKFLIPPLPAGAIKKIVRDLCEWGLVKQLADGRYEVTNKFVEPPATLAHIVRQLQREWILQGREALARFGPDERHISSILLGISQKTRDIINKKIDNFRKEIFDLIELDQDPEVLMQLSLQYFPKSETEVKK
jgi:uncharacterized protein (TIGR02147 family)